MIKSKQDYQIIKLKHRKNNMKEEDQTNQPFESMDLLQEPGSKSIDLSF